MGSRSEDVIKSYSKRNKKDSRNLVLGSLWDLRVNDVVAKKTQFSSCQKSSFIIRRRENQGSIVIENSIDRVSVLWPHFVSFCSILGTVLSNIFDKCKVEKFSLKRNLSSGLSANLVTRVWASAILVSICWPFRICHHLAERWDI